MPRYSSVANTLFNWTAMTVAIATGLVLTPLIITSLGKPLYGAWSLVLTVVGYTALLNVGITPALAHYVGIYRGQGDNEAMGRVFSSGLAVVSLICLAAVAGAWLAAEPLANLLDPSEDLHGVFVSMLKLAGVGAAFGFMGMFFATVLRAHELFLPNNGIVAFCHLFRAVAIAGVLLAGGGALSLMIAHLAAEGLKAALLGVWCHRQLPHLRARWRGVSLGVVGMLTSFGLVGSLMSIGDVLRFQLDQAVIGKYLDFAQVAVYAVAAMLVRYMLTIVGAFADAVAPRLTTLTGSGQLARMTKLFLRSLRLSSAISCMLAAGLLLVGGPFLRLWLGPGFAESAPVLWVLTACFVTDLAQAPAIAVMFATKKHGVLATVNIIEGLCNLALSIYLAPRLGIVGVALGTAIPMLAAKLLVQPLAVGRVLGISYFVYWRPMLPGFLTAAVVVALGFWLGLPHNDNLGWLGLLGWSLVVASPFLAWIGLILRRHGLDLMPETDDERAGRP